MMVRNQLCPCYAQRFSQWSLVWRNTWLTILKTQWEIYTGKQLFPCHQCPKTFSKYGLKIHLRTHTGKKLYNGNNCPKVFLQSAHLNRHLRSHSSKKSLFLSCLIVTLHTTVFNSIVNRLHMLLKLSSRVAL